METIYNTMESAIKRLTKLIELDLPKKDNDGRSYLSYSQIQLFKRDREEYYRRYILNKPFEGNAYTDFGSKVGEALENNCFDSFNENEKETLSKCVRLDEFEKEVKLAKYYDCDEADLKTLLIAEKIIKEYGISEETHKAISIVEEQIEKYLKK
jgi:hypothetical protein